MRKKDDEVILITDDRLTLSLVIQCVPTVSISVYTFSLLFSFAPHFLLPNVISNDFFNLSFLLVSLVPPLPPPPCVVLFLLVPGGFWGIQLALLQYRLCMSSMPCQPHPPPGSGTLHTYQVLLPFHSAPPLRALLRGSNPGCATHGAFTPTNGP